MISIIYYLLSGAAETSEILHHHDAHSERGEQLKEGRGRTVELRSERDVEAKVIAPLFRDVLGYQYDDMHWAVPVDMQFGREIRTKEANLVVTHNGDNVVVVEAKKPSEPALGATG